MRYCRSNFQRAKKRKKNICIYYIINRPLVKSFANYITSNCYMDVLTTFPKGEKTKKMSKQE